MINRDITVSNNKIHDLGFDFRGIMSVVPTYITNATISHNEIYNLPYTGVSIGYGWGANEPGGNTQYANRGLYNYQPRYTTATTASNNKIVGNYIHDVMQQMTDGACIYTLSWNPGATISGNYCLRTNGFFGVYFDEGSKYYTVTNNVFASVGGTWATANYFGGENMGNFTLTNNWANSSGTNITNGDRGNRVSGNVTVSNGNWPSGAQAVINSAGLEPVTSTPVSTPPVSVSPSRSIPPSVPISSPPISSPPVSVSPSASASSPSTTPGTGCTALYQNTGSWPGGFQATVTVTNTGTTALTGWTLRWAFPNGQTISSLWNGAYTQSGANVTVTNASYNGGLAPGQSAVVGFTGGATGTNNSPSSVTCG